MRNVQNIRRIQILICASIKTWRSAGWLGNGYGYGFRYDLVQSVRERDKGVPDDQIREYPRRRQNVPSLFQRTLDTNRENGRVLVLTFCLRGLSELLGYGCWTWSVQEGDAVALVSEKAVVAGGSGRQETAGWEG